MGGFKGRRGFPLKLGEEFNCEEIERGTLRKHGGRRPKETSDNLPEKDHAKNTKKG